MTLATAKVVGGAAERRGAWFVWWRPQRHKQRIKRWPAYPAAIPWFGLRVFTD